MDGAADGGDGVEVFQFDFRAERFFRFFAQRDVHVAAELAFFHVGIGDAALLEDHLERAEVGEGFLGGFEVGLGDDFHQRRAGAVEVDERRVAEVGGFRDVLFEVDAVEADFFVGVGDAFPGVGRDSNVRKAGRRRRCRGEDPSGSSDSSSACPDRNSSSGPSWRFPASRSRACRPVSRVFSMASRLSTGSAPGRPRQTGQVWVFGVSPKEVRQAQNILVLRFDLAVDFEADGDEKRHGGNWGLGIGTAGYWKSPARDAGDWSSDNQSITQSPIGNPDAFPHACHFRPGGAWPEAVAPRTGRHFP